MLGFRVAAVDVKGRVLLELEDLAFLFRVPGRVLVVAERLAAVDHVAVEIELVGLGFRHGDAAVAERVPIVGKADVDRGGLEALRIAEQRVEVRELFGYLPRAVVARHFAAVGQSRGGHGQRRSARHRNDHRRRDSCAPGRNPNPTVLHGCSLPRCVPMMLL